MVSRSRFWNEEILKCGPLSVALFYIYRGESFMFYVDLILHLTKALFSLHSK